MIDIVLQIFSWIDQAELVLVKLIITSIGVYHLYRFAKDSTLDKSKKEREKEREKEKPKIL